jgi:predicted DNA-binding transcriptional regulator AlpA
MGECGLSQLSTGLSKDERRVVKTGGGLIIYTYKEVALLLGISLRAVERMVADGTGPEVIKLTARRRGITDIALRAWLRDRPRKIALITESEEG